MSGILTKRVLSRRTVLRGGGTILALPLLDCMVPPLTALNQTAARAVRRLGVVYVPNGMMMPHWTPSTEGSGFELSPILAPLAPVRGYAVVLSGLADRSATPVGGGGAGPHARASGTFLTGVHIRKTEGADIQAGISMDQIAARTLGQNTQLASLELALESVEILGGCDAGYSCAYTNTISWRSPTTPLPMENDPRAVFERLFGVSDTTDPEERRARLSTERSLLDAVADKAASLQRGLGPRDRGKLSEYLDAVRDVERRIQRAEEQAGRDIPAVEQPAAIPPTYAEHAEVMFDLLALAYQSDLTRVSTFMLAKEISGRAYPEIGVPDSHHPTSHHQNDAEKLAKLAKINTFHVQLFARFVEKLMAIPDGDGSLLDHSMFLYGAAISDSNTHFYDNLPIVLVGGRSAGLAGGRHVRYMGDPPLTNLYLSLLDRVGVQTERLGDSTGRLEYLSDV
ncbi:MAG: DUF1552 domain-containing protein [Acidimicrobiia bacterium]|nr:DUF1552 domain-containing protein [Acidimicrobiia bacterium]